MAAAEPGADNRALHPDPRPLHLRTTLLPVPTHPRVHHLLHEEEIAILVWDDLTKTRVLDEGARVAPAEAVANRADSAEIVVAHRVAAPKVVDHLEIEAAPPAEAPNPADPAEIAVARLRAVRRAVAEVTAV